MPCSARTNGAQSFGTLAEYPGNGPGNSPIDPKPTVWWFRPVSRAARVGEQSAVTWKPLYLSPCSATRVIAGVETGPPNVDGLPKPASSISTSNTFGAPSGGDGVMLIVQSATDASSVRPTVPAKFGSGIGSTVRSGLNFPIASASDSFNALMPCLSLWTTERSCAPASACPTPRRCVVVEDRDDPGRPRRQVLADLVVDLLLDPVVDEPADHPAGDRPDGDRRQQRRREQAHRDPDSAAPARPLAAEVVARLAHADAPVLRVGDEDDPVDRDLLRLDERDQRLEVLRRLGRCPGSRRRGRRWVSQP